MPRQLILLLLLFSLGLLGFDSSPRAYRKEIKKHRKNIHKEFKNPAKSPFRDKATEYKGLDYYAADLAYRVEADFIRLKGEQAFEIQTSNPDRDKTFVPFAQLRFSLNGKELTLTAYKNLELPPIGKYKDHLFLPFTDLTNGESSYGGGRYIDLSIPKGDKIVLDFNKCYNPYCAYRTDGWSCPIPPEENFLDMEIRAGVKKYAKY